MSFTDKKLASKTLEDTVYNTVTAMTNRLVRYNRSESNIIVSMIYSRNIFEQYYKVNICKMYYSFTTNYL